MRFFEQSRVVPQNLHHLFFFGQPRPNAFDLLVFSYYFRCNDLMLCHLHYYDQVTQPKSLAYHAVHCDDGNAKEESAPSEGRADTDDLTRMFSQDVLRSSSQDDKKNVEETTTPTAASARQNKRTISNDKSNPSLLMSFESPRSKQARERDHGRGKCAGPTASKTPNHSHLALYTTHILMQNTPKT